MRIAIIATVVAATLASTSLTQAGVEVDATADVETPLRIKPDSGQQPAFNSTIIILRESGSVPAPYPGGCFNCSTLRSNGTAVDHSLERGHSFSQKLYQAQPTQTILLVQ
ncbi:MAG: hypothetical protein HQL37_00585 [Alphaproteobacteria bacterium]|nr:hypothetical protein [Alphaproteobacteria bacterium]